MSSADQLARFMAGTERRLNSLERAAQLTSSSVEVDGVTVPVAEGIAAGLTAGAASAEALAAAQDAYDAAHNIGPDQLAEGAVVFGKIAAGAVGALAIKADAIDGKKINGVEITGALVTGSTLRTAASGARIVARPGASSINKGNGVLELWSSNTSEEIPGEVYVVADGSGPNDNISLVLASPKKNAQPARSTLQLFAGDDDSWSAAILGGEAVQLAAPYVVTNTPLRLLNQDWVTPATLTGGWSNYGDVYESFGYRMMPDGSIRLRGLVKNGNVGAANPLFKLPVGFRPAAAQIMLGAASGGVADIRIFSGGEVCVYGFFAGGSNASVSLGMVSFMPASS